MFVYANCKTTMNIFKISLINKFRIIFKKTSAARILVMQYGNGNELMVITGNKAILFVA